MNQVTKQHYVPRFYLKNFTTEENNNKIFCYDKINNSVFPANIQDIAQEKKFYEVAGLDENEIENAISKLEREFWAPTYAELIHKKNFKKLSFKEKNRIYHFLSLQLIRTKAEQEETCDMYNAVIAKITQLYGDTERGLKMISEYEQKKAVYLSSIYNEGIDAALKKQANNFGSKNWVIRLTKKNSKQLIASDSPIAFANSLDREDKGFMRQGAKIFFPLRSDILFYSYDRYSPSKNNKEIMTSEEIDEANEAQIRSSTRFIYRSINDFKFAEQYLEKYPIFMNPRREFDITIDRDLVTWKYKKLF